MDHLRLIVITLHAPYRNVLLFFCVCVSVCGCMWVSRLLSGTQLEVSCVVAVMNQLNAVNISNGFTYKSQLTPVIASVSPRRGGTAGGTLLTITGSGFRCSKGVSGLCTDDTVNLYLLLFHTLPLMGQNVIIFGMNTIEN